MGWVYDRPEDAHREIICFKAQAKHFTFKNALCRSVQFVFGFHKIQTRIVCAAVKRMQTRSVCALSFQCLLN